MQNIISIHWLQEHLDDPHLTLLDASYPPVGGEKSQYDGLQLVNSRRFDIDYFSDQQSSLPHMLLSKKDFQDQAQVLGINKSSHLVIYDNMGIYAAPRAWWMFKIMGHENVSVLDGGLPGWIKKGLPTEKTQKRTYKKGNFQASFNTEMVKSFQDVSDNLEKNEFQLIDARSKGRFSGEEPEPRPELSSGHVPASLNIPFKEVLENGKFKSAEDLKKVFQKVDPKKPLTFSCGSGLTACIVMLAAEIVLDNEKAIYDGSWTEWASKGGAIEKY